MKQMIKNFFKGLGQIGAETGKEALKQTEEVAKDIAISSSEWLGGLKPVTESEYQRQKQASDQGDQAELAKLRAEMAGGGKGPGREVEKEIEQIRAEKKRQEEEEEKQFLENLRRQREAEKTQDAAMMEAPGNSHKKKKKRGGAFLPGKKQQASQASMSNTGEFKGKVD
jgi:hypothetical protein